MVLVEGMKVGESRTDIGVDFQTQEDDNDGDDFLWFLLAVDRRDHFNTMPASCLCSCSLATSTRSESAFFHHARQRLGFGRPESALKSNTTKRERELSPLAC
jgi:hypothetical protein